VIFGDPPWGGEDSVYDDERPASHYHAMPLLSAFPVGGISAVHEAILSDVRARQWPSRVLLNLGVLPEVHIQRLALLTGSHEVLRFGEVGVLACRL
jgi:hypothetical protein